MNEQIVSEVFKRIDVLSEKISLVGADLGKEAIRYTWATAIGELIVEFLFIVLAPFILFTLGLLIKKQVDENNWDDVVWIPFIVAGVSFILGFVISVCSLPKTIATIIAPTWAVIQNLL